MSLTLLTQSVPSDTRLQLERYAMKWSPWLRSVESENWLKLSSCLLLSFIGMLKYETLMPCFSMAAELFLIIIKKERRGEERIPRPRVVLARLLSSPAGCLRSVAARRSLAAVAAFSPARGDGVSPCAGRKIEATSDTMQDISGHDLVKALQIKNKIPRRKALLAIEENVLTILTEEGYVSKEETTGGVEVSEDVYEEEDEDEVIVVDGEVDEGDVHIKPISRKPVPLLFSEVDVKLVFKEVTSKFLRKRIVEVGQSSSS
ncbi:hypothetical protein GW17_00036283 [Ensete ventricosum]|nr:hypothetical protein GW17_00036283 [Ensete ventricosum]